MATTPQFPSAPRTEGINLANDTLTSLLTAGTSGTYCDKIEYFNIATNVNTMKVFLNDGTSDFQLREETLFTSGTIILDFAIPSGISIKVQLTKTDSEVDITGSVSVVCFGGDY